MQAELSHIVHRIRVLNLAHRPVKQIELDLNDVEMDETKVRDAIYFLQMEAQDAARA